MEEPTLNKDSKKKHTHPFYYKLLRTIIQCLVIFCFLLFCLYIVGNFQNFGDKSQQILLKVLSYTSMFTSLLTIPLFIENLICLFVEKKKIKTILALLTLLITVILCFAFLGASHLIVYLAEGL